MAGERRGARVLRVGRSQDRGAPRRGQRGNMRQQDLCAGRGRHMIHRRRAIGLRGDRGKLANAGTVRQPGENFVRQRRQRVGVGIDPGRQIDEWFGRAVEHPPRRGELPTVGERLQRRGRR